MGDEENKKGEGKGFAGLSSLVSDVDTKALPASKPTGTEAGPSAAPKSTNASSKPLPLPHPVPQGPSSSSSGGKWLLGIGVAIGAIWLIGQLDKPTSSSTSEYTPSAQAPSYTAPGSPIPPPPQAADAAAVAPLGPTVTMPPVGNGLVLSGDQIRYCVYEDRRIKGAEKVVDNYNQTSVSTFNGMVEDYNSRCSHFRYRAGALTPIEDEANAIQVQLEQEGQARMTSAPADATSDAAAATTDAAAAATTDAAAAATTDASPAAAYFAAKDAASATTDVAAATADAADAATDATAGDAYGTTYQTSFDCGKARSIPEFLICHDSELAAEDRELAQIYQQAKAAVGNSAELSERARKQWNFREKNCRDKSCLLSWFSYQKDVMNKVAQTGDVYAR